MPKSKADANFVYYNTNNYNPAKSTLVVGLKYTF